VDLSEDKLALARSLGATHTFNAGEADCIEKVREVTACGADFAFELAGSTRAFESAYKMTRRGGTTVTAGLPPPTATMPLSPLNLVAEERTIKGSYIGTCVPSRDIPRYVDLYRQGKLAVDRLMTGKLTLDEINEGFDMLHEGKAVRQVIVFD
jgi:alcohol dehydrogenase